MLNAPHDQLGPRIPVLIILSPFFQIRVFLSCTVRTRCTRRKCAWSEDMTRSSPSCRHPFCPLKLGRSCHQTNASDGSVGVWMLFLLHVLFIPNKNLLLLGI